METLLQREAEIKRSLGELEQALSRARQERDALRRAVDKLPELEDQIANAIIQAQSKGDDRTSKSGNILIFGAHGSGKTTLLNIIGGLDRYDSGDLIINGISTETICEREKSCAEVV